MRFRFIDGAIPARHAEHEATQTVDTPEQAAERVIRAIVASEGLCDASLVRTEPNPGERPEGWESHVIVAEGWGPVAVTDGALP